MLANSFNVITENDRFYGIMDAVDHEGNNLILYYKTLDKDQVINFIYKVRMHNTSNRHERSTKINASDMRLNVCKKLLLANVKFVKEYMREYITFLYNKSEECLVKTRSSKDINRMLWESITKDWAHEHEEWKRALKVYGTKLKETAPGMINDMDIEKAKQYNMTDLLSFNSQKLANCIFHNEKNPSLKYYKDNNTVHCFGCNTTSDTIGVAMKLNNENFINAVKRLSHKN